MTRVVLPEADTPPPGTSKLYARRYLEAIANYFLPMKVAVSLTWSQAIIAGHIGRKQIEDGSCEDTLPEMAAKFQLSTGSVRTAIQTLQAYGMITIEPLPNNRRRLNVVDGEWLEWLKDPVENTFRLKAGLSTPGDRLYIERGPIH